jgi:putative ABC transport system substrate-binding protein
MMRRREFITLLGGAAAAWPLAAGAQERLRHIGILMGIANDQEGQRRIAAFRQGLQELGWTEGRDVGFEYRWGAGDIDSIRAQAAQLIALRPDLIMANSTIVAKVMKQETQAIPIVFVQVADPVRDGIVTSLARPGGNITGFTGFEYTMGGKWLETLKEVAPAVARVAILHHPQDSNWPGFLTAIERGAPSFGVQLAPTGVSDAGEIESAIDAFAKSANGGLLVLPTPVTNHHRKLIFAMAARHRLPAIYPFRFFAADGGLVAYGFDPIDPFRRAASYANRILKGEKPADLPVQAPIKYELVINLKTAKALGLEIPPTLLARADEVIE